jgi:hypothetical protein
MLSPFPVRKRAAGSVWLLDVVVKMRDGKVFVITEFHSPQTLLPQAPYRQRKSQPL